MWRLLTIRCKKISVAQPVVQLHCPVTTRVFLWPQVRKGSRSLSQNVLTEGVSRFMCPNTSVFRFIKETFCGQMVSPDPVLGARAEKRVRRPSAGDDRRD